MADAAEFFANKKKKKKAFKFNANLVSPSAVAPSVHIEAPALSTSQDAGISQLADAVSSVNIITATTEESARGGEAKSSGVGGEEWDDEAMAATLTRKGPVVTAGSSAAAEVLDMKSLDKQRGMDPDDIAEKLRVEETKAKLAAAREGMEREAAKLKEEKEKKELKEREKEEGTPSSSRFGLASKSLGAATGRWVPPQQRAGAAASLARSRVGGTSQKFDVENEELFPDLATAEKILEQKEQQKPTFKAPKKTSVGGGASWASKTNAATATPTSTASATTTAEPAADKEEPLPAPPQEEQEQDAEPPQETKANEPTTSAAPRRVPTKTTARKKKDVSTFKPSAK